MAKTDFKHLMELDSFEERMKFMDKCVRDAEARYNKATQSKLAAEIERLEIVRDNLRNEIQSLELPDVYEIDACVDSAMREMKRFTKWLCNIQQRRQRHADED